MRPASLSVKGIVARVVRLNVPVIVERSIKLSSGSLIGERVLVSLPKAALGPAGLARLLALGEDLGLPSQLASVVATDYPVADIVHIGFEGPHICKLYLEFAQACRSMGTSRSVLVFRAVKWNVAQPASANVATYRSCQHLTGDAIARHIVSILEVGAEQAPARFILGLLERALKKVSAGALPFLEVEDEGTPRRSFDLNLYDADFRIADAASDFAALTQYFGLAVADAIKLFLLPSEASLGHVAAGVARDGRDFLTIYYGAGAP